MQIQLNLKQKKNLADFSKLSPQMLADPKSKGGPFGPKIFFEKFETFFHFLALTRYFGTIKAIFVLWRTQNRLKIS